MIGAFPAADVLAWSLIEVLWKGLVLWALRLAVDPLLPVRAVRLRYTATAVSFFAIPVWWLASLVPVLQAPAQPLVPSVVKGPGTLEILLIVIWVAGVSFSSLRVAGGLWQWHRTVNLAVEVSALWRHRFQTLVQRTGLRQGVRLLASNRVDSPCALGWFRPVVLVPASLLTGFNPDQLQAILLHELVHVRRLDWLVGILQAFVESLLFHVPFVWFLSARLRLEREACCDDAVVEMLGNRLEYATALYSLEAVLQAPRLAPSAHGGSLVSRIRRLADPHQHSRPRASVAFSLIVLTAALSFASIVTIMDGNDPLPTWLPQDVSRWAPLLEQASENHDLPPALLAIMTLVESGGDSQALSSRGATGLLQIMPATGKRIAEKRGLKDVDLQDPSVNLDFGAWYLARQFETFGGDLKLALAAYNGGPERARRWSENGEPLSEETSAYVAVLATMWDERDAGESTAYQAWWKRLNSGRIQQMLHPLPVARVSQVFGRGPHKGVDLAAPLGTAILTPMDGEVISVSNDTTAGKAVVIRHGVGLETRYHHLDAIDVALGDRLSTGDTLG
ncbi:MAG: transglycosylase SLT domain-containing protein, partial [Acidobacteria bacterium]|nr:transglycosylase SLT domain-containing protein [Acidobacteriota bacterium]